MQADIAIEKRLRAIGALPAGEVPLVETLLLLARVEDAAAEIDLVHRHLDDMRAALAGAVAALPAADGETTVAYRLERLNAVIRDEFGYGGDSDDAAYDDPANISFPQVVARRRGIPVAIGVLYLELARSQGWSAAGLNFPGHFLLRLEHGAERAIIDPFNGGAALDASGLRRLLKSLAGPDAELQHNFYDAVTPRDVVLRFCNNRKSRYITQSNYAAALNVIGHELWIAPDEPRLYYDAAILCAKIGRITEALESLAQFVALSNDTRAILEAKNLIRSLQLGLH